MWLRPYRAVSLKSCRYCMTFDVEFRAILGAFNLHVYIDKYKLVLPYTCNFSVDSGCIGHEKIAERIVL